MEKKFPRVLVVTPTRFNLKAGGGVTMGNLFRGWPKDNLAQVYSTEFIPPDESVCTRYFTGRFDFKNKSPQNIAKYPMLSESNKQHLFFSSDSIDIDGLFQKVKMNFTPDLIYTDARDNPPYYLWLGKELASKFNVPYVLHVMDDWPNRFTKEWNRDDEQSKIIKDIFTFEFNTLISKSSLNICISPEMAKEYKNRYGIEFSPFHNTIDIEEWFVNDKYYQQEEEVFTITYIGAVTKDKELYSLIDIKDAVVALNKEGYRCEFRIYTADIWKKPAEEYLNFENISGYAGFLDKSELPATLTASDLLVLPINFDEKSLEYIKLSIQTKVPEYMASGTPSLVYAPAESPNSRYAREERWGYVVSERNVALLKKAVKDLIKDEALRKKLGERGRKLVKKNHDAKIIRNLFRQKLVDTLKNI